MNRRDLFSQLGLLTAASSVAVANGDGVQSVSHSESDSDFLFGVAYHAVYMFVPGLDDFVFPGIYTTEADAAAHADRIRNTTAFTEKRIACVGHARFSHEQIVENLIGQRMGRLSDVLNRLEARLMIDDHESAKAHARSKP